MALMKKIKKRRKALSSPSCLQAVLFCLTVPDVSFQLFAPSFMSRFLESHAVMFQGNAGLKPKEGELTSRPWQWPINLKGQFFSGSSYRIYLLGNPIIWWSNLVFLGLFLFILVLQCIRQQRGYAKPDENMFEWKHLNAGAWLFAGWLLHYLPFWAMGRVLYFHHYFPALIYNSMLTGIMFDYIMKYLPVPWLKHIVCGTTISILVYSFKLFAPLAYGMSGPTAIEQNSTMFGLRWMDTWEF